MNITKPSDPIRVSSIIVMIYGDPSVGKTTLGYSTECPLLLDFDKGSYRTEHRTGDTVLIERWSDVARITDGEVAKYQTIIVDTIGRAVDTLSESMPDSEGRVQLKRSSGEPTLPGYGYIARGIRAWLNGLRALNKNIVLLAHSKHERDGDTSVSQPEITGKSQSECLKISDFVGYMHMHDANRSVIFTPGDRRVTKGSSAVGSYVFTVTSGSKPDLLARMISDMVSSLNREAKNQEDSKRVIEDFCASFEDDAIAASIDGDGWNILIEQARGLGKIMGITAFSRLRTAAENHGYKYAPSMKCFMDTKRQEGTAS